MTSTHNNHSRRDIISLYTEIDQDASSEISSIESVQDHISTIKEQIDFLMNIANEQGIGDNLCSNKSCTDLRNAVLSTGEKCIIQAKSLKEEQSNNEKKLEDLEEKAYYDKLTGLPNRHYLYDLFDKIIPHFLTGKRDYSVAILDIDHFKKVNDTYGHEIGDIILKNFSDILNNFLKSSKQDAVARLGGEEFIIVSSRTPDKLQELINKILKYILKNGYILGEDTINYSFSGGISQFGVGHHDNDKEKIIFNVLKDADQKLYQAKQEGRKQIIS